MSGVKCKVIACVCGAAQEIEKGNTLLAYRQSEGEQIKEHPALIEQIKSENDCIYDILRQATELDLLPLKITRLSLPLVMRQGYQAIIENDDSFTDEQLEGVISHGTTAENLGKEWNTRLLKDADYPPD